MSADQPMNPDFELPAELREIETQLEQLVPSINDPVNSGMGRDSLMYQAGWAAAEASGSQKLRWFWPATSAALAASLVFLLARPPHPIQQSRPQVNESVAAAISEKSESPTVPAAIVHATLAPSKRYPPQASMLAMRERALRFEFDEPTSTDISNGYVDDGPIAPSTSRELMREFLPDSSFPNRSQSDPQPWWSIFRAGESA